MSGRAPSRSRPSLPPYTSLAYDGERLLYIPDEAYELATGKEWHRATRYCYESFSNRDGWPPPAHLTGGRQPFPHCRLAVTR